MPMNPDDYQAILPTPFGALGLRVSRDALTGIDFLPASAPPVPPQTAFARQVCAALRAYLDDPRRPFDLPLEFGGTEFQRRVWRAIAAIPAGKTLTYSELAEKVGSGARAVANACGANPMPVIIPCHRVVARDGLGGFMKGRARGSLNIKQWLLAHERGESRAA
ncbi:MAG: methylated-DNA--[protein]-cysteine S-methyltransferase [Methylobacillus sp.]|jgi:methylated-DNA-[protein]-cysteine S-methyltransferase|nr:methylated-DNA--[protein]-cysteine S-methyltransferase [Methylobacillus sp.]